MQKQNSTIAAGRRSKQQQAYYSRRHIDSSPSNWENTGLYLAQRRQTIGSKYTIENDFYRSVHPWVLYGEEIVGLHPM